MKIINGMVCFNPDQYHNRYLGYPAIHMQTAIHRLRSGKPFYLASPIYRLSRQEVGALLVHADDILKIKTN